MATGLEKQDQEISRNAKRARQNGLFNNTIPDIIASKYSIRAFAMKRQFDIDKKNDDIFVGGYLGKQIDHIEKVKAEKAIIEEQKVKTERHPLIERIYDVIPESVEDKSEIMFVKGFELELIDEPMLKLKLCIKRVTSKSLICHITEIRTKEYFRFASETDKTVVKDLRDIETTWKESAKLFDSRRQMLRIVDKLICKYRITAKPKSDPWSNLLED